MSIDASFRRHIENEYDWLRQTCYNIINKGSYDWFANCPQ